MPTQACPSPTPLSGSLPATSAVCTQRRVLHPRPLLLSMCLRSPSPQSLPPSSLSTEWIAPRGTLLPVLCAQTPVCGQYDSPPEVGAPYKLRIDIPTRLTCPKGCGCPLLLLVRGHTHSCPVDWEMGWRCLRDVCSPPHCGRGHRGRPVSQRNCCLSPPRGRWARGKPPDSAQDSRVGGSGAVRGQWEARRCCLVTGFACCTLTLQLPVAMALHRSASRSFQKRKKQISLSFMWHLGSHQSPAEAPRHL